tara:strand:- start:51 stop:611 length:561 start_codon:yes stop_codon:yes gene_type:complete
MNIHKLFPTTVIEYNLTGYPNKSLLLEEISNLPTYFHGLLDKGLSSFSKHNAFLEDNKFHSLKNQFQKSINNYSDYLSLRPNYIFESWFNIMEYNGQTLLHNHRESIISGAYYPLLEGSTCNLLFRTPLHSAVNYNPTDDNENYYKFHEMKIKEDHLYLFPGWLEHFTKVNEGGKRVCISFNTKFY